MGTITSTFWLIGPGGAGNGTSLNITAFPPTPANGTLPSAAFVATDTGSWSSTVQLLSLPNSTKGPATGPMQVRQIWNTDGSVAFPTMPNRPSSAPADLTIDSAGNVSAQTSSARFKTDIMPLNADFERILALEPKKFRGSESGDLSIGYIAEDLASLSLSDLVIYDQEGAPLSVHYKLIPIYILEVLKRQQAAIKQLVERVHELSGAEPER